ncbi:MAG: aspartate ammonia-lyase [Deltaproteobacteria bacterium]|nr:aspartate ammonia-lyase [Deltaproteobacteria bacterium]
MTKYRIEKDSLGEKKVPFAAYYGVQTVRAGENFPISGIMPKPVFIIATAMVKKAACAANRNLGLLDKQRASAITRAADEVISGKLHREFIVDVYQAGAGTSHNMNANEVIANRAIELLGDKKGDYSALHPNDHVNMSQSTNDVIPTAMRLAALASSEKLLGSLGGLEKALKRKSREFDRVIKSGRTHLQDAVPIRLGQEFGSYGASVRSSIERINCARGRLKNIGLGGTAVGTGLNTHPSYTKTVIRELGRVSGIKGLRIAPNAFEAIAGMGDFSFFSASLRSAAIELIRIANDLRLLSSGPRTGIGEIILPAVQPGSSIMPGKVNPVMAEMLNMVCFQVVGNDTAVTLAAQAGQLELNVMMPVINYNILESIEILDSSVRAFTERCVSGIKADRKRCKEYFENSAGLAAILNKFIGYEQAAQVAKESIYTGKSIKDIVIGKEILTEKEWKKILEPMRVTQANGDMNGIKNKRS